MGTGSYVAIAGIIFLAATVQGVSGFGFSLLAVPLLAASIGAKEAVVLADTLGFLANGGMAVRLRADTVRPVAGRLLLGSCLGMPFGVLVILAVDDQVLRAAIGVVVLLFVVVLARGWTLHRSSPALEVGTGVVSGVLNTSVGTSGPPIVLLLHARGLAPGPFRATASTVFGASAVIAVALLAAAGQFTVEVAWGCLAALPGLAAGWWVGDRIHRRLDPARFRGLVLGLLAATGVVAVVGAALA